MYLLSYYPVKDEDESALYAPVFNSDEKYKKDCVEKTGCFNKTMKALAENSNTLCDDIQYSDIRYKYNTVVGGSEKVNNLIQNIHSCFENSDGARDANFDELIKLLCMEYEVTEVLFPSLRGRKSEDYYIDRLKLWADLADKMGASKNPTNIAKFNFSNVAREIDEIVKAKSGGQMGG